MIERAETNRACVELTKIGTENFGLLITRMWANPEKDNYKTYYGLMLLRFEFAIKFPAWLCCAVQKLQPIEQRRTCNV